MARVIQLILVLLLLLLRLSVFYRVPLLLPRQVAFQVDGTDTMGCGQCRPGETGLGFADLAAEISLVLSLANYDASVDTFSFAAGALFSCALNEFCNDAAQCVPLTASPLFGLPCPLETPTHGWCGPGLHCIAHVCQICAEGAMDATRLRLCLNGKWTTDAWAISRQDPAMMLALVICAVLCVQLLITLFSTCHTHFQAPIFDYYTCTNAQHRLNSNDDAFHGVCIAFPVVGYQHWRTRSLTDASDDHASLPLATAGAGDHDNDRDREVNSKFANASTNPTWVANVMFAPKVPLALSTQPPVDVDNVEDEQEDHWQGSDSDQGVDSDSDNDRDRESDGPTNAVSSSEDARTLVMTVAAAAGNTLLAAADSGPATRGSNLQKMPPPLSARDAPHPYVLLGQH